MIKFLMVSSLLVSGTVFAEPCCDKKGNQNTNVNVNVNSDNGVKWRTVYKDKLVPVPVTNTVTQVVPSVHNSSSSTYVEKVVPVDRIRVFKVTQTKVKYKYKKRKAKKVYVLQSAPRHYFSVLAGRSNTDLYSTIVNDQEVFVKNRLANDFGGMYQFRITDSFILGAQATYNRNYYISLGFGF